MFSGRVVAGARRRSLIEFDIAGAVPPGATIDSVELQLHMSRTNVGAGPRATTFHRVLIDWAEGPTDPTGNEGFGDTAANGDATWFDRVYPVTPWSSNGGDYVGSPSSTSVSVNNIGFYNWPSTSQLVADVQGWLDDPSTNHGWALITSESGAPTAKRFDSRHFPESARRPKLTITFSGVVCNDVDRDGYGDPGSPACPNGPELDCNDGNPDVYPGAAETWYDGVDQNCDGLSDFDQDGDGVACDGSSADNECPGVIGTDCNDLEPLSRPGFAEVCGDLIDNDCSGGVDDLPGCAIPAASAWGVMVMALMLAGVGTSIFRGTRRVTGS